jgi:hypothetical protein
MSPFDKQPETKMPVSKKRLEAYASGKQLTDRIAKLGGRCMEQVIDKQCDLFFERWMFPNGVSVVAMYSPDFREVFIEATSGRNSWEATDLALRDAAEYEGN